MYEKGYDFVLESYYIQFITRRKNLTLYDKAWFSVIIMGHKFAFLCLMMNLTGSHLIFEAGHVARVDGATKKYHVIQQIIRYVENQSNE